MMRWMTSWEEAAKRPWRAVMTASLSGLVVGALYGYFRFGGDRVVWGVVLGLAIATVLGVGTWRTVHDPARVAEPTQQRAELHPAALRWSAVRLALPFVALGVAAVAGAVAHSLNVFVIALALGFVVAWKDPRAAYSSPMARLRIRTTVEQWDDVEGWGALAATEDTPGGVFVYFTAIRMDGFRTLRPGQDVEAVVEDSEQDGYPYQATVVRPIV